MRRKGAEVLEIVRQVKQIALIRPTDCASRNAGSTGHPAERCGRGFADLPKLLTAILAAAAATSAAAAPCDAPEFRQFDFWLGHWEVRTPDGRLAGRNHIERGYGGCVLHERYRTERGYAGESLNVYDAARRVWHQTWVDNGGLLLQLDGGLQGDSMVLEGDSRDVSGALRRQRIRWTPNADGSVRQHWQSQAADGSWQTVFDGYYRRHVPAPGT